MAGDVPWGQNKKNNIFDKKYILSMSKKNYIEVAEIKEL